MVFSLVVLPGGDVIAGGFFSTAGGVTALNIARYNPSSGAWSAVGAGTTPFGFVYSLAVLPGGDVIVGGGFTAVGGATGRNHIARVNPSTGVWSALGAGTNDAVYSLSVLPGGDVIVGGSFTTAGGMAASRIARYNPSTGAWSALGAGMNGTVYSLAMLPGGDVMAGGSYTTAGALVTNFIARYNLTTNAWTAFGSGTNGTVYSLVVLPENDVIVGGNFTTAGGIAASRIARINPSTSVWFSLGAGTNDAVYSLTVLPGGDMIAGGNFTRAGVDVSSRFARYTFGQPAPAIGTQPQPTTTCTFGSATFSVTPAGFSPVAYQWQWQQVGVGEIWSNVLEGVNADFEGVARFTADGAAAPFVAVSRSSTLQGTLSVIAALRCIVTNGCGGITSNAAMMTVCPADFNCSGSVSVQDIFNFLIAYFTNNPNADFNASGTVSVQDIFDFLAAYFAGCA